MKCLCCRKKIEETASKASRSVQWHDRCVQKFFGTKQFPQISLSESLLMEIAKQNINEGYTVPGVQKKISLHLTKEPRPRLTLVDYPTGYILKPQTADYPALPEAEYLVMQMAVLTGIATVPFALIKISERGDLAYITKRIDRTFLDEEMKAYAMEDFCQLDERLTADKYHGSYERCAKVIQRYSARSGLDLTELFLRVVFSFVVGNSDLHLKNFSLIETRPTSGSYVFSPAYDLLPVNVILPDDPDQLALTLNGKKRNLRQKDFFLFSEFCGLSAKTRDRLIEKVTSRESQYLEMCQTSELSVKQKERLSALITQRTAILRATPVHAFSS